MGLGKRQIESLKQFGEIPHPHKASHTHWKWGDWHLARKIRSADGIWSSLKSLIAQGLIEVRPSEKWKDCFECRTTDAGRSVLELRTREPAHKEEA